MEAWKEAGIAVRYAYLESGRLCEISVRKSGGAYVVTALGETRTVSLRRISESSAVLDSGGRMFAVDVVQDGGVKYVIVEGKTFRMEKAGAGRRTAPAGETFRPGKHRLNAPLPGRVASVRVSAGDSVKKGQVLVTLEAMKMENSVVAPVDSVVSELFVSRDDLVEGGAPLLTFEVGAQA